MVVVQIHPVAYLVDRYLVGKILGLMVVKV